MLSEGFGRIFNVLLSIFGARTLGPAQWGLYSSALGVAQIAALATDLGGHLTLSSLVARSPRTAQTSAATSAGVKLILMAGSAVVLIAATPALHQRAWLLWPLAAAALALSCIEWLGYFLRGIGRVREEALLLGCASIAACAAGTLVLTRSGGPEYLAISQAVAMSVGLIMAVIWIVRVAPPLNGFPLASDAALTTFLRTALPTGAAILLSMTSWRLVYIVQPFGLDPELGLYAVAQRLLEIGRFLPAAVAAALFPSFAGSHNLDPGRSLKWLLGMTIATASVFWIPGVAGGVLTLVFGNSYADAAPALSVFALALPFMSVNAVLTHWLVARGHVRINAGLSALHLIVHITWLIAASHGGPHLAISGTHVMYIGTGQLPIGILLAEAALSVGTLIAWRRLK